MPFRPKILFLVHRVPYPPNRGDRIRSYHMLRFLADHYDVSLATLSDEEVDDETLATLSSLCGRMAIERVSPLRWQKACLSLAAGGSATEGLFDSSSLRRTISDWASSTQFDAVVVFCSGMVQYVYIAELNQVPIIVDLVDVDSQKWLDYAVRARMPKRWLYQLEGNRLRKVESSLPKLATAITFVSDVEADIYRGFCKNSRTYAIKNGVDLEYFQPVNNEVDATSGSTDAERSDIVFVGALDYPANIDAMTWFAADVWPSVRQNYSDLTLAIVGRRPAVAVRRLSQVPGIRVFGDVEDVRPYVAAANVAIAPLRIARGIQNKVLEAMAMGKPVICSTAALEGLAAQANEHLLIADRPSEWCDAIQLLHDRRLAQAMGARAREFVETNHNWRTTLTPLGTLITTAMRKRVPNCQTGKLAVSPRSEQTTQGSAKH